MKTGQLIQLVSAFIAGVAVAVGSSAVAAKLVGEPGYLIGWDVVVDGETICSDPFVWPATMEIDCG